MIRPLRLYQSEAGIWRYDVERDGVVRWQSLHTRSEKAARKRYTQIVAYFRRAELQRRQEEK